MLEELFLRSLKPDYLTSRIKEILHLIQNNNNLKVGDIAKRLVVNESTLYRLFVNQVGQNPKSFLRTVRFRSVLNDLLHFNKAGLARIAYRNNYTDQSHFIRDFKELTGQTPKQLKKKTSLQQEELAWIYTEQ